MSWWHWFTRDFRTTTEHGVVDGAPLVRVINREAVDALEALGGGRDTLANAVVIRECDAHRTVVLRFSAALGLDDRQAYALGHEVSHAVAALLSLSHDPTHDRDGGRYPG